MEHLLFTEKYRGKRRTDCILPERLKKPFQEYVNQSNIPNLLLAGGPGVGKTTVAKAMCEEVGCDYMVINGSDENGVDIIRFKIKNYASSMSLSGGRKVVIIDEADYLTLNAQAVLRNAIEEYSLNCSFIFTCNYKNRLIEPLHSRCAVIEFGIKGKDRQTIAAQFFKRIQEILGAEGVEYDNKVLVELINKHFPDWRRVLNECQRYSVSGKIDAGILATFSDVAVNDLLKNLKEKNFPEVRKWVVSNMDNDTTVLLRRIYDALYVSLENNSVPAAVLVLAKYQYQSAFVADQEINMLACLTEIMVECEFQ